MAKKIWNFFCSAKLTVVLFVLILIPSTIGTIIQQNAPEATRIQTYGPAWDSIFRLLGFYDVYHDIRFIILLVLLGINTFVCTVNRFRPKWQIIGMTMTHLGLLLILLGALIGAVFGVKGYMGIAENETLDEIALGSATHATAKLPFKVKLLDFILDVHEEPGRTIHIYDVKADDQTNHKLEMDKPVPLSEPGWGGLLAMFGVKPKALGTIEVKRFYQNAAMSTSLKEGPEETGVEAIEFRFTRSAGEARGFTVSGMGRPFIFENARIALAYKKIMDAATFDEEIQAAVLKSKAISRLEVTVPGAPGVMLHPAEVGSKFKVEGLDYTVEVLRYVPDFTMDMNTRMVTSKSDHPHNPALQIRVTGPSGPREQWIFSKFPSMHRTEEEPFEIKFKMDLSLDGARDYLLVISSSDGESNDNITLAHTRMGELVSRSEIEPGQALAIEGTDYELLIDNVFRNANMSRELVDDSNIPGRPMVEVVLKQDGEESAVNLWEGAWADGPGYKLLYSEEERIRDFYSVLQVIEGEKVVAEKKIEVNDPLRYAGYSLYQSSWDQEGLRWSGLQVRKDPGVPLVYAGFLIQIMGMIVIFYINPLIRKAKKSQD